MSVFKDLRYGARKLVRNPAFAAVSVLTLALGIGLTTTMFSIVYGAMMRGLPYEGGDRLVAVDRFSLARPDRDQMGVSLHDFHDWRQQQKSFEGLAAFAGGTMNVSGTDKPERYDGAYVSANLFQLLSARPHLGRTFREGEDAPGSPAVVVLSYALWRDRFGSDPGVLGKTIRVNAEPAEIVGVMPDRFSFPANEMLWVPLRDALEPRRNEGRWVGVVGKLKEGVSLDAANVEVGGIARRLQQAYPENKEIGAQVKPFTETMIGEEPRALLWTMLGAVFMVLLIACANVANLLLSQAAMRAKEVAVRSAMGASRARIALQFLTEPLALAVAGAVVGTGLAWVGIRLFNNAVAATDPPAWLVFRLDAPILLFVLAITLFATFVSGVLPAIRASGANVGEVLKDESRGSSSFRGGRLSKVLVVFEVALSVTLLVAAGLTVKSITRLGNMDYGFPTDVFTARIGLPEAVYKDEAAQVRFAEQLYPRVAELPGAEAATITASLPGMYAPDDMVAVEGKAYAEERDLPRTHMVSTMPGHFATFQVKVEGRDFTAQDNATSLPVAIVNATFARELFGSESPIGRRIRLGGKESEEPWRQIVGVVPDMWLGGQENEEPQGVYVPFAQSPQRFMSVVVRTRGEAGAMTAAVRDLVAAQDPDLPIYFVMTLQERIDENSWFYRVFGTIFMIMGAVALFLAAIGLYGVMAFNVSRRTREMGVRMALGAQPADVTRMVLRQGLIQLAIGLAIGTIGAFFLARLLTMILFQVAPTDPLVFGATLLVLLLAGVAASLLPARRATRVDPMVALRYE